MGAAHADGRARPDAQANGRDASGDSLVPTTPSSPETLASRRLKKVHAQNIPHTRQRNVFTGMTSNGGVFCGCAARQSEKKKQSHADSALFVEVDEGAGEARGYLEAAWLLDGCEIAWAAAQSQQDTASLTYIENSLQRLVQWLNLNGAQ